MEIFYLYINEFDFHCDEKHEKEHKAGLYLVEQAGRKFFNIDNTELDIIDHKPYFKFSNIHFSISHSNNIACVCFDKNPLGLDIEFIKERNWRIIAKRMNFNMKENTLEEFYRHWTMYEAEYKLKQKALNTSTVKFLDNYILSIASSSFENIKINYHLLNCPGKNSR